MMNYGTVLILFRPGALIGLLVGAAVCGVLAAVVVVMAKKSGAKLQEILATLSEDTKNALINAPVEDSPTKPGAVIQTGLLHEIKGDGAKVGLVVILFNRYYPNFMNEFMNADISVKASVLAENNIKAGDFVKIQLDENGGKLVV